MVLRLALLVCDTPVPAVVEAHGKYPEIYDAWLTASNVAGVPYELTPFDVVNHPETYPNPDEFDGIILTGSGSLSLFRLSRLVLTRCLSSAASAYSPLPWIQTLTQYTRDLASLQPRVKVIGICFGHQIVAQALGGQVVPNDGLWEIGVSQVRLTSAGMDVFGEDGGELIVRKYYH
jgi:GMP synthase-like glutamine amidotransferase